MPCKHFVILGAGISGLAAGWFIRQSFGKNIRLTILEKEWHVGGWIQTICHNGFQFEQGPRSCRIAGNAHETIALIEALRLEEQVIVPPKHSQNRYIYDGKILQRMPKKLWEVPFNPLTKGWWQAMRRDATMPIRLEEDESIFSFFSRRIGNEWTNRLIDPMVLGIYGGDMHSLSMKSCFPLFNEWEQKKGSLFKGAWAQRSLPAESSFYRSLKKHSFFSFKTGMNALPLALAEKLKEDIVFGKKATKLQFNKNKVKISLENQEEIEADQVLSTLPTYALEELLMLNIPMQYASITCVHLGYHSTLLRKQGFGYLVPSFVKSPVIGCVWESSIFPQHNQQPNQTRLSVMLKEIEEQNEEYIINTALTHIKKSLCISEFPQFIEVKKAVRAIPQYGVGYDRWRDEILARMGEEYPRLIVTGPAWTGVSINDCIMSAKQIPNLVNLSY